MVQWRGNERANYTGLKLKLFFLRRLGPGEVGSSLPRQLSLLKSSNIMNYQPTRALAEEGAQYQNRGLGKSP